VGADVNLPPGFVLDQQAPAAPQGPPDGFVLDQPKPPSPREQVMAIVPRATSGDMARNADDLVRSTASGATFGLADELAAGASTLTGIGGQGEPGKGYTENLAAERARDKAIPTGTKLFGEVLGGMMTGTGLAKQGMTLLNTAKPTLANMLARGGGEGVAYGAAHGFGHGEGLRGRLEGAAYGGTVGAVTGGLTGAVASKMAPKAETVPTTSELKAAGTRAYAAAKDAGVIATESSFGKAVDDIAAVAKEAGIDRTIHSRANAALTRLQEAKGAPQSLGEIEILRRVAGSAAKSPDRDERRIARVIIDKLDDYIGNLSAKDIVSGDAPAGVAALNEARSLWSRMRKSDVIEGMIEKAKNAASNFSGSGYENSLRTQFRQLANNEGRLRGFSEAEREAIQHVARGGPMENALRMLGKFAPTGVVSSVLSSGAGAMAGGAPGAIALPAMGLAARKGATMMTGRNADLAAELMRAGGSLPAQGQLSSHQQQILSAILSGGGDQAAPVGRGVRDRLPLLSTGR